jgi:hypothetical protein
LGQPAVARTPEALGRSRLNRGGARHRAARPLWH